MSEETGENQQLIEFLYQRCTGPEGHIIKAAERLVAENERLHRLTEGDPTSIYHEAAGLRAALSGLLAHAETWSVEFYGDDGDLLTTEEAAAFAAARAVLGRTEAER